MQQGIIEEYEKLLSSDQEYNSLFDKLIQLAKESQPEVLITNSEYTITLDNDEALEILRTELNNRKCAILKFLLKRQGIYRQYDDYSKSLGLDKLG